MSIPLTLLLLLPPIIAILVLIVVLRSASNRVTSLKREIEAQNETLASAQPEPAIKELKTNPQKEANSNQKESFYSRALPTIELAGSTFAASSFIISTVISATAHNISNSFSNMIVVFGALLVAFIATEVSSVRGKR